MSAPYVIAASMIGCAFGWLLVPWASDVLLHRVRDRADAWWAESLEAYRAFKRDHPEDEPSSSASGTEGAVGIWRDEAFVAGLAGSLTEERLQALAAAGFKVGGLEAAGTADERRRRYSFEPRPRSRMLCAAALGTAFAVVATIVPGVPAAAMLGICASAMAVSVVCDLRARVIPLEACGLVAVWNLACGLAPPPVPAQRLESARWSDCGGSWRRWREPPTRASLISPAITGPRARPAVCTGRS